MTDERHRTDDDFDELVSDLQVEGLHQASLWEEGLDHLGEIRKPFDEGKGRPYESRAPCPTCKTTDAILITKGSQNTVRCTHCNRLLYNAPKTETGEKRRTVQTLRQDIRPSQQARILDRDHGRCVLCGSNDELTIGHLLSIEDGAELGATAQELNDDANLAAMCEACNLGLAHGPRSVSPRTYAVIMHRLLRAEVQRVSPAGGRSRVDRVRRKHRS